MGLQTHVLPNQVKPLPFDLGHRRRERSDKGKTRSSYTKRKETNALPLHVWFHRIQDFHVASTSTQGSGFNAQLYLQGKGIDPGLFYRKLKQREQIIIRLAEDPKAVRLSGVCLDPGCLHATLDLLLVRWRRENLGSLEPASASSSRLATRILQSQPPGTNYFNALCRSSRNCNSARDRQQVFLGGQCYNTSAGTDRWDAD